MKKSLSTFILLAISNLYGEVERVIPPIKAQISIPNPKVWKIAEVMKHHPIEKRRRNSGDSAIFLVK
ncbi:hypothetical protein D8B45_03395 [Candidatus Gracilibacteria bacterium]|nr:MAG: hypothetical protein D8B45_03395 [Candidatus Gracilibacteria bacterium]